MRRGQLWQSTRLGNAEPFTGPRKVSQLSEIFMVVRGCMPEFAESARREGIKNENGLNRKLARFISRQFWRFEMPYTAQNEAMEDEKRGDSPAVDIGIHLLVHDSAVDPPKVTVLEGKRLDGGIETRRRREYVYGPGVGEAHRPCGGMERFKNAIHGRSVKSTAMLIGYMQTDDFPTWWAKVNSWIAGLSDEPAHNPPWSREEQLSQPHIDGPIASCSSTLSRVGDRLWILHLWVDLVDAAA